MYDTILVPTDGSEVAVRAAREAFDLARATGATVHVVFVVDESASSFLLSGDSMAQVLDALEAEGESAVERALAAAGDVPTETTVVRGMKVSEAIEEYVDRHGIDLVVMGTRGRHGVDHLLGSTTERVLANVGVPTLVVGDDAADEV
ncbi:universal stress protein [Halosegnis marinus]|uniref:Universal stress protein n=1 Tax=Halosegnis marinus TaxID=3034023 RepID=A0ABD5ZSJ2_9EURY|nr:universal stress protein [Halosegnis sp. DT85]